MYWISTLCFTGHGSFKIWSAAQEGLTCRRSGKRKRRQSQKLQSYRRVAFGRLLKPKALSLPLVVVSNDLKKNKANTYKSRAGHK